MNIRLQIEQSILGAIIYCDGYSQVAHILTPNNFSSIEDGFHRNRELYAIITEMYPSRPIDLISISHEVRKRYTDDYSVMQTLCKSDIRVQSTSSIGYWAYILLQIDISEKYKKLLSEWRSARIRNLDHAEAGALKEIIESVNNESDIFDIIEGSCNYFLHLNMQDELALTKAFNMDLDKKAKKVKAMSSINTALGYLFKVGESSQEIKYECEAFANAIADMIITNSVKPQYSEAANIITK